MSTVGEIVDRVYREYLHLADDQPVQAPLNATVTAGATSWVLDADILDPDEVDVYVEGTLVECGLELALVVDVSVSDFPDTITLTVKRGMAGTTAAAHDAGDLVQAAPAFPRRSTFDAVADQIEMLYPSLYAVKTATVVSAAYAEVPAGAIDPIVYTWLSNGRIRQASAELFTDLPAAISSTGKAVHVHAPRGVSGTLTYRSKFDRAAAETDDAADLGVDPLWENVVVIGAAAQMLSGRELDQVTMEYVTEQVRAQGYPVTSASRQRNELIRFYQLMLAQARSRQLAERAELVTLAMPQFGSFG